MIRVGIVGCGGIAVTHIWALKQVNNCRITALCDIKTERAVKLGEMLEYDCTYYEKFEDLLNSGLVDVVHICTPHYLHGPMAVRALRKNLSVFMEKPAVISGEQLTELQAAAEESRKRNIRLGICLQNRYNVTTKTVDGLVESGELGRVIGGRAFVTWRRDEDYYAAADWKGKWTTEGGGALMNQSIHTLDLLLRYLGEPVWVEAGMRNHHTAECVEVEDTVEAWLEFPEGQRACFYASNGYASDAPVWWELQCEQGRITVMDHMVCVSRDGQTQVISCDELKGMGKGYWGGGHLACIRDFYHCLETNENYQNDLAGVLNTVNTTLKIYEEGKKKWNR